MSKLLLETIRIEDGRARNLRWHQARFDHSRAAVFGRGLPKIDLQEVIFSEMKNVEPAVFKCRILYEKKIQSVDFQKYTPRKIETLQLVEAPELDYNLKWADRRELEKITARRGAADEVLIVKNGLITDTSYANVAFWDGSRWLTPAAPLLAGTCRARLLAERRIFAADIRAEQIFDFLKIRIFNSMLGWRGGVELTVSRFFHFLNQCVLEMKNGGETPAAVFSVFCQQPFHVFVRPTFCFPDAVSLVHQPLGFESEEDFFQIFQLLLWHLAGKQADYF